MSTRMANHLSIQFNLSLPQGTGRADVHAHGERVMQELLKLETCNNDFTDSTVSTDAQLNTITIELLVFDLTDPIKVLQRALDIVRAAAHAAGGATPDWPNVSEQPDHVEIAKTRDLVFA